jgi:HAMP domain-containing protein
MAALIKNRTGLLYVPLRGPLTLVFVLLVLGTTLAAGWMSYRAAFRSVEEEALASLKASAAARDTALAVAVGRKRERLQSTLQSVELGCGITGVMMTSCASEMLRPFLRTERASGAALYYGRRQLLRVGAFHGDGAETGSGLPLLQVAPNKKSYVSLVHSDRESGLTLAVDFSTSGLMNTTELLRESTRVVTQIGGQQFLLTENGLNAAEGPLLAKEVGECFAGTEASALHDHQYISLRPSRALGDTCLVSLRDEREILAPVLRLKARIARVGVAFGAVALALAYLLAWLVARPIVRLRQRVRALRKGDYDSPVPIVGIGEVRELAHAFTSM